MSDGYKLLTKRQAKSLSSFNALDFLDELETNVTNSQNPDDYCQQDQEGFRQLFDKYVRTVDSSIDWNKIEKLPVGSVEAYSALECPSFVQIQSLLSKLVVVKLNGGLGTSMGCKGPKSVISVRDGLTFLDLTVKQIEYLNEHYDVDVPLVLMNSFNTDEETLKVIKKFAGTKIKIYTFNQSKYPRINKVSMSPVALSMNSYNAKEAWYPPGHGDFYRSFYKCGLLEFFIKEGRTTCFISNIDNMGATVDVNILNRCIQGNYEFVMEVTDRTRADVKGGTLIQYGGKLRLLEVAQVAKNYIEDFKSVKKFNVFNTNNLWLNLSGIKDLLDRDAIDLEVIVNPKTLSDGTGVIQLETAVGAAMKCFDRCIGINVSRSRFIPVKKCSDLLLVKSNLYNLMDGSLVMSPERMFNTTPLIKLCDEHFQKVAEMTRRFCSIPDILELDHLTVSGNVFFGSNITLKGTVIIIAHHGEQIDIPSGSILENKIISGNLRILDH